MRMHLSQLDFLYVCTKITNLLVLVVLKPGRIRGSQTATGRGGVFGGLQGWLGLEWVGPGCRARRWG